jgi:transcriptional regulator with XRE-family HTH domain
MPEIQASGYSPTIKKRSLGRKLVELRKQCGMTTAEVCKRMSWSPTKLNYIEKARWIEPSSDSVADLCELYGVDGAELDALLRLTREARQRGWWRKYNDVFPDELPGFEAGAASIRTFEANLIPGLLQVGGYIELVARVAGIDPAEIKRHVDARLTRQKILTRDQNPCRLHAVIDESAILRITDDELRAEQIRHLVRMAKRRTVDVQVLPLKDGVYSGIGEPFVHLSFPDPAERDIVYLETAIDDRMLEEVDELNRYRVRFDQLCEAALTPAATRTYLQQQTE